MFIRFSIIQCATDGQTDGDGQSDRMFMVDTYKNELLLGGGIRHLTATSQYHVHSKQVPACVCNIV